METTIIHQLILTTRTVLIIVQQEDHQDLKGTQVPLAQLVLKGRKETLDGMDLLELKVFLDHLGMSL